MIRATIFAGVLLAMAGCNESDRDRNVAPTADSDVAVPTVAYKPSAEGTVSKPGAPFTLKYKVVGTPIVGSPVPIELRVVSSMKDQPFVVSYKINDATALQFPESQAERLSMKLAANEEYVDQMITVIPLREGRQYVNVSVAVETEEGSRSMVMAVPIQVGEGARELEEHGELTTDEEGESIRALPAESP